MNENSPICESPTAERKATVDATPIAFRLTKLIIVFPKRSAAAIATITSKWDVRSERLSIMPIDTKKKLVRMSRIGITP